MAIFDKSKKMDSEELKDVNGGYINFGGIDSGYYMVIDDKTGHILEGHIFSASGAKKRAIELGQSDYEITEDELWALYKTGKQPERP